MDQFLNFYNFTGTEFSSAVIVFNIVFAFVLGLIIVWAYRKTHQGLSYSQQFVFTIILMAPLASVVMMIVEHNLIGAFGLLGAFSLIRFRTIIKETRDVAFVFFALTTGVAVGTTNYAIALLSTILISLIILILYRYNFGSAAKEGFILTLNTSPRFKTENLNNIFSKYLDKHDLVHAKTTPHKGEYAFVLKFKNENDVDQFIKDVRDIPEIEQSQLITGQQSTEY